MSIISPTYRITNRLNGLLWLAVALIAVFMILYNISLQGRESLSSARLTVFFLLILAVLLPKKLSSWIAMGDPHIFLIFAPAPYVLAQFVFVHDFGQFSRFLNLFIYSYLGAFLIARMAGGLNKWLLVCLWAVSLQAVIILYSFFSLDYRAWVDLYLDHGGNFGADNIYRAPGFTSDSGSSLSVIQSMGVLAGGLSLLHNKANEANKQFLVVSLMLLCTISCVVVGRTGFILSVIFIFLFVLAGSISKKIVFSFFGFLLILIGVFIDWVQEFLPPGFSVEYYLDWAFGFIFGEDQTINTLRSMPIPPLDSNTFFGVGLVSLVNGENPSGHDSGFVQAYYSMGLIMASIFYCFYAYVLVRLLKWVPFVLRYSIALVLFLIEFKEPFAFKYAVMFLLVGAHVSWRAFENRTGSMHENRIPA